jgi:hypothetical protein
VVFYFDNSKWNVKNHHRKDYAKRSIWICVFLKLFLKSNIIITNDESDEQFFLVEFHSMHLNPISNFEFS